jgi:hypothetical protein
MELGNAIFGHSRGACRVNRGLQDQFWTFLESLSFTDDLWQRPEGWRDAEGFGHTNGVFTVRPYYWGECNCGGQGPRHAADCRISTEWAGWVSRRMDFASGEADDDGFAPLDMSKLDAFPEPPPTCSCGAEATWVERECAPTCSLLLPNFVHHPSGFELRWYKYPLRDSYSNRPLTSQLISSWQAQ